MDDVDSIIITGESDWTIYSLPNFIGIQRCLETWPGMLVGFFPNLSDLEMNSVRSFREGCFDDEKIQHRSDRHGEVVMEKE
ncbi:unnamed protein product [Darwinula stevensoni]|uniref:Uncharacterized protein n=1 Tax=Darwinula stevensoni TaxID=69355 RepID=A0A7R9FTY4_9CRUS|nr:unnamed protein product [Darwinula stevensoni]CAG0906412.1 unnamed protein product [Darwinula stevensoni]